MPAAGGSATARAAAARLVLDKVTASSPYSAELAKRAALADMRAQMADALPAARAKLARLMESRAEEKYRERMKLETDAVKAELRVDASDVASPGGQPSPAELAEQERVYVERERIERELRGDP
jgi:hypothetical protein